MVCLLGINSHLQTNAGTYSKNVYVADKSTFVLCAFPDATSLLVSVGAGQAAGHLCQPPRVLFILHGNVAKEGEPVSHLQGPHHGREPVQRNHR